MMACCGNHILISPPTRTLIPFLPPYLNTASSANPPPRNHTSLSSSQPFLHSRRLSISSSAADTVPNLDVSPSTSTQWSEFAQNVSGEWDGFGADFTSLGNPIELPESVVPEAYREWEVKVFDWQTQCPTLADPHHENLLSYKIIKLLPTVGCEADAATRYSIDERNVGGVDNGVSAFAYQSSGCYVAVWPIEEDDGVCKLLELEHCLIDPQNRESRVRIIHVIRIDEGSKFVLKNIRIFREQWCGPFRNGEQLGGCAIRDSAFASLNATKSSEVTGIWEGRHAVATFDGSHASNFCKLLDGGLRKSTRDESNLILLPKQLWCSLREKDGQTSCEVGWLLDSGHAITSTCIFTPDGKLKASFLMHS
ncbi:hypothetical protein RJ641_019697 [Dillenia turbinata]|uniref:Uncharacterized protein n=1 Tax=Dillenia turbinata TaxID=194707 RepID=A0AAN8URS7_9MAGN